MTADLFVIDGHAFSWRRIIELRRQQLAAIEKAKARQLALFEVKDDHRPAAERRAADRYLEPSLLPLMGSTSRTAPRD